MGPSRTMAAAYGRTEKPAPGRWREWYKLWTWRARAEAWDGMIEARARGAVEIEHQQRLVEHLERQRRIATANLSLAESMIAAAARRLATGVHSRRRSGRRCRHERGGAGAGGRQAGGQFWLVLNPQRSSCDMRRNRRR